MNSDTQITATVPSGATSGLITVTTPGGTATSLASFTVIPTPTLASFLPTSGALGGSVVLSGTGFTGATVVSFNGTSATSFSVDSDTQITATVPSGATSGTISVTTPGGTATSATSFTVLSSDDTLSALTISAGTLSPSFAAGTLSYSVVLPYGTTTVPTVVATTTDPNATALVTQAASVTGAATVVVTAADGVTQQTYTITFSVAPSSDTAIVSTIGTVDNTALTITAVPFGTTAAALTAALSSTDGSLQSYAVTAADGVTPVSGALTSGDLLVVTAADGTQATYAITVLPSSDDTLSNLTVSAGTLKPTFAAGTLNYTDSVANSVAAITVTPTTNDPNASYVLQVAGMTVTNPTVLSVGATTIDVVVTAQNGDQQTYSPDGHPGGAALRRRHSREPHGLGRHPQAEPSPRAP